METADEQNVNTSVWHAVVTVIIIIIRGSAVALHYCKAHVQSNKERANFDPMISKSLKFCFSNLNTTSIMSAVHVTSGNFHCNPFSGGFSPDS